MDMWQWFTNNGVWILIISAFVLIMAYFVKEWVRRSIKRIVTKERYIRMQKGGTIAFRTILALTLITIVVALVAVILSREGAADIVTPEMIQLWFLEHGISILIMLLMGAILWFVSAKFIPPLVIRLIHRPKRGESLQGMKKRADTLVGVFVGLVKVLIAIVLFTMILTEIGIQVGPILAGFGVAGIAVGFGAQYLIRDLIAGIFILMENQYRIGDVVGIGDIRAQVEEVNLRKTVLRDLDGIVHHIPNGEIKMASNYARHFSRVNLDVPVAYGTDLDHAIRVINSVGQELAADDKWSEHIITPPQVLRVNKFDDSGIDIRILGDCKPLQQWALMGELRLRLKKAFDQERIEIPWPHVKLYFGEMGTNELIACKTCSHPNLSVNKFCSQCGASLR